MVASRIPFGWRGNILPGRVERGDGRHRLVRGQQRQRRVRAQRLAALAESAVPDDHRRRADRHRLLRAQPPAGLRALALPGAHDRVSARGDRDLHQGRPVEGRRRQRRFPADVRRRVRLRRRLESVRQRLHALPAADREQGAHRPVRRARRVRLVRRARDRRRGLGDHRRRSVRQSDRRASPATCPPASPISPCWPSPSGPSAPMR